MIRIYKAAEINDKWLRDRGEQSVDLKVEQAVAQIIARVRKEGRERRRSDQTTCRAYARRRKNVRRRRFHRQDNALYGVGNYPRKGVETP